jgi:hypothetical protein
VSALLLSFNYMKETDEIRYRFSQPIRGLVSVLNEKSYVMATYNPITGQAVWQRVVAATQRASIEQSLLIHYPIPSPA